MNIIPPRLNKETTYFGFTGLEAIVFIFSLILFIALLHAYNLAAILGIPIALLFRWDGENNAWGKLKSLLHYYHHAQHYSAKEVKNLYEISTYNRKNKLHS